MKPIARLGDTHDCPLHGTNAIVSVSGQSSCDARAIAKVGDRTGCGAVIATGSPACIIDGKPAATIGSLTSHGGIIVTGSRSVA